jgi:hypothetical protein
MKTLHGQPLIVFQEEMKHVQYIPIDKMSFIEFRLFVQIESCLREAFPTKKPLLIQLSLNNSCRILGSTVASKGQTSLCRSNSREEFMDNLYHYNQFENNLSATGHF